MIVLFLALMYVLSLKNRGVIMKTNYNKFLKPVYISDLRVRICLARVRLTDTRLALERRLYDCSDCDVDEVRNCLDTVVDVQSWLDLCLDKLAKIQNSDLFDM